MKIIRKKFLYFPFELGALPFDLAQGGEFIEPRLGGKNIQIREPSTFAIFKRLAMKNLWVLVFGWQCRIRFRIWRALDLL